jgi:hypothetical protein
MTTTSTERSPVAAILALGLTQIIGYRTLYYSFSILAHGMARDLDWSSEWIFGALSAALLIGGLAAPTMGRWIDRFGAGRVMSGLGDRGGSARQDRLRRRPDHNRVGVQPGAIWRRLCVARRDQTEDRPA